MLKKNTEAWCASNVKFSKLVVMRYTTLEAYTPNAIAGKYDGEQAGTPSDIYEQIKKARPDMKTFFVPGGAQPAMIFNTSKYPVSDPLVRKAIAYMLDIPSLLPTLEVGTKEPDPYVTGIVPSFRDIWFDKSFLSKLTNYSYNPDKATELLKQAGWSKGSDGFWRDGKGQLVQIEVSSMNNWPTFFLGGDAIVNQMNQFGLKAQFKPMEYGAYNNYLKNGEHTIGLNFAGNIAYGHPWGSYKDIYRDKVVLTGLKDPKDTSSALPDLKIKLASGETVSPYALIDQLFYTMDQGEQKKILEQLAQATNEFLPIMPIGEKTVPYKLYHTDTKFKGYPEDPKDPYWYGGSTAPVFGKLIKNGKIDLK
jgi:peptide/nickel transport system substrate-binding protein